jgi:hypothetical protein
LSNDFSIRVLLIFWFYILLPNAIFGPEQFFVAESLSQTKSDLKIRSLFQENRSSGWNFMRWVGYLHTVRSGGVPAQISVFVWMNLSTSD